jgi:NAD(P) transhydrogenase subunit alpha
MKIGILKEPDDARVAMIPSVAEKLIHLDHQLTLEKGAGERAYYPDADYEAVGVHLAERSALLPEQELLIGIHPPPPEDRRRLPEGAALIALFNPRGQPELAEALKQSALRPFSLDSIPRTTIAQSMDVLSSMASLAGYKAVVLAADHLPGYFPMLMTAAGTIPPAKVLVLGAGVAGLQAIATAKRLGATVEAFDVRSAVKEEVQSLGAKFIEVPGAAEDQEAGGYAVEQSEAYQRKQKELIHERAARADAIVTTASIPGRRAPLLVEQRTVEAMRPGSVIVDLAAATGGNCAVTQNDASIVYEGVRVIGDSNLPASLPRDASFLLANNMLSFIKYVFPEGLDSLDYQNEVVKSTYLGAVPSGVE